MYDPDQPTPTFATACFTSVVFAAALALSVVGTLNLADMEDSSPSGATPTLVSTVTSY